ncbi:phytochrome sensor protein [Sulfuriferula plumbiphila]|uniref:Phytochrome sensor protein n=1 Tax=Sulfuriferula plumbiphila TaxID=171865 RepID=A0A512L3U1_9PROT|nr:type II secretion system F family protein [Sulfuriferula plumbiphila]BBP05567.1 phytochrome sensor protein [Sulfuriferula plumbiphila]GEP29136.1 phytochrome sensor protein [Sulfuriferula plumbiphila]
MPYFSYRAVDQIGRTNRGSLSAANEVDLELRLRRMGLDLITLRQMDSRASGFARGAASRRDLITFCFHLEQISRAGIPILDGVRDLRDSMDNPRFRDILTALLEDMEGGRLMSQALAAHPAVFDTVIVNLVRAGEQTGLMREVFENLGASLKRQDELAAQTRRLLIYPTLVLSMVGIIILLLLLFLVPQIADLIKNMGIALPIQTRVLLWLSETLRTWWPLFLILPVAIGSALVVTLRASERARFVADDVKLRLPVIGPILQKIALARFSNFFALMYRSGITILDALRAGEDIAANRVIADAIRRAGGRIGNGEGLTESFQSLSVFPPLVIRMLRVGETTGALDTALENVSYFYTREVSESIEKSLKILEPALTVVLGLVMAVIVGSVLLPMYDVIGTLKP